MFSVICRHKWAKKVSSILPQLSPLTCRQLSVKELSWCASPDSPNRNPMKTLKKQSAGDSSENRGEWEPIQKFGIIAAMSKNRVIGVHGHLPWNLPEDRAYFKKITSNSVLLIGRRTFEEESNQCHISHAAGCIVISETLEESSIDKSYGNRLELARSLPEALHKARLLSKDLMGSDDKPNLFDRNKIKCWVAGGERVYAEAMIHPSASSLHLTLVDCEVNVAGLSATDFARFPAKYRWDNRFEKVSETEVLNSDIVDGISCTRIVFRRIAKRVPT